MQENKNIEERLLPYILEVENPARYLASEFIIGRKTPGSGDMLCAICFPDLYEIGMSNSAVKIIYNQLNNMDGVCCDRVFAVAPDFERLLREKGIPLFTIENLVPLRQLEFLGVSIGYELSATNILQVLELGGIPIHAKDRTDADPIVIAGGPAATNPLPFAPFFDFVFIGESEAGMEEVVRAIRAGGTRAEKISRLKRLDFLWHEGRTVTDKARRAVDMSFGSETEEKHIYRHYPVSSFDVVHDHGTAEIMRGCPNGCRFCHAGQYYKPFRQRSIRQIEEIVEQNVREFGFREVTLSSLSSGDYPALETLIDRLNGKYKADSISFSLPSLKVSSFSLDILEKISEVRRSGLTFAIETPLTDDQRSMNKEVDPDKIIDIILQAKKRGWKLAKFYFMTGLPFVDISKEEESIADFLLRIRKSTGINMNINIGTFIPKAHTPFQWVRQLSVEESREHLRRIKHSLQDKIPGIKVSYHEPVISFLEGVISRGDISAAGVIEEAYKRGARMDAWDEHLDFDLWTSVMEDLNYKYRDSFSLDEELPWDSVSMNVSKHYLRREYDRAASRALTPVCSASCDHNCGVCGKSHGVRRADLESTFCDSVNEKSLKNAENEVDVRTLKVSEMDGDVRTLKTAEMDGDSRTLKAPESPAEGDASCESKVEYRQVILKYRKAGRALLNSHKAVMRQFEMAFMRSGIGIRFTEGFNPKPRMEFLNPLSMGVRGEEEALLCEIPVRDMNSRLCSRINSSIAAGYEVYEYIPVPVAESGRKISLSAYLDHSVFSFEDITDPAVSEKLDAAMKERVEGFEIKRTDAGFDVIVSGEKNLFKNIFGLEMSKFYIAEKCIITRKHLVLKEII